MRYLREEIIHYTRIIARDNRVLSFFLLILGDKTEYFMFYIIIILDWSDAANALRFLLIFNDF